MKRLTEFEVRKRVIIFCENKGYTFLGWVGDKYITLKNTKVRFIDDEGVFCDKLNISNFLLGQKNPSTRFERMKKKKRLKSIQKDLKDLEGIPSLENKILLGRYSENNKSFWLITCGVCCSDEIFKAGLCSGVFKSSKGNLIRGTIPCRCNKNKPLTKEQNFYITGKICDSLGLKLLNISEDNYTIKVECKFCKTVISKSHSVFKHQETGCRACYLNEISKERSYGYYPERYQEKDYVYLLTFKDFIKVGRTFNINRRLKQLKLKAKEDPTQINIFTGNHELCFNTEQFILEKFKSYKVVGWSIELLELSVSDEVLKILNKELLNEGTK